MWNENALTDGGPVDSSGHESNGVSLDGKATEEGHRIKKKNWARKNDTTGKFHVLRRPQTGVFCKGDTC